MTSAKHPKCKMLLLRQMKHLESFRFVLFHKARRQDESKADESCKSWKPREHASWFLRGKGCDPMRPSYLPKVRALEEERDPLEEQAARFA